MTCLLFGLQGYYWQEFLNIYIFSAGIIGRIWESCNFLVRFLQTQSEFPQFDQFSTRYALFSSVSSVSRLKCSVKYRYYIVGAYEGCQHRNTDRIFLNHRQHWLNKSKNPSYRHRNACPTPKYRYFFSSDTETPTEKRSIPSHWQTRTPPLLYQEQCSKISYM